MSMITLMLCIRMNMGRSRNIRRYGLSTLDQIGSYSVTINAAGKAGMSRVMQDYNAYDTSTSDLDDFVPTFSTGASGIPLQLTLSL